jgi:hypothetical protein
LDHRACITDDEEDEEQIARGGVTDCPRTFGKGSLVAGDFVAKINKMK